ncbi:hypothetical protein P9112_001865 [Eukaryota sp. TZLM1-RC]
MTHPSSKRCFQAVSDLVTSRNLKHSANIETNEILSSVSSDHGSFLLRFKTRDEEDLIIIYSQHSKRCPPHKIKPMIRFINRANYGLPVGCFELDTENGEVRFRTAADVENVTNLSGILITLLSRNVKTFDRYLRGIELVFKGGDPDEACDLCEGELEQVVHDEEVKEESEGNHSDNQADVVDADIKLDELEKENKGSQSDLIDSEKIDSPPRKRMREGLISSGCNLM